MTKGSTQNIRLPNSIKDFISFYFVEKCRKQGEFRYIEENSLPLTIIVKGLDVANKRITYRYKMKYDLYVKSDMIDVPNKDVIFGRLSFE